MPREPVLASSPLSPPSEPREPEPRLPREPVPPGPSGSVMVTTISSITSPSASRTGTVIVSPGCASGVGVTVTEPSSFSTAVPGPDSSPIVAPSGTSPPTFGMVTEVPGVVSTSFQTGPSTMVTTISSITSPSASRTGTVIVSPGCASGVGVTVTEPSSFSTAVPGPDSSPIVAPSGTSPPTFGMVTEVPGVVSTSFQTGATGAGLTVIWKVSVTGLPSAPLTGLPSASTRRTVTVTGPLVTVVGVPVIWPFS